MLRPHDTIRLFASILLLLTARPSLAQNYTWSATGGGTWIDGTKWGNGLATNFPRNANDTAIFSTTGNSAARSVTLDAAISIRALQFGANQTGSVTIASGSGGTLTLTNTIGQTTAITVDTASGDHTLAANLTIGGLAAQIWSIGTNRTFTISGSVSGTQGLLIAGGGTALFNGANTYSGSTLVGSATLTGRLGGQGSLASAVTIGTGGTITAGTGAGAPSLTLNNGLTLSGRYLATLYSTTTSSNLILPTGTAAIGGGSLELALGSGVTVAGLRASGPHTYIILDAANGQLSGTFTTTNFTTAGFAASEWSVAYDTTNGNVTLNFTPVPEPATILGIASAGVGVCLLIRRRSCPTAAAV